MKNSKAMQLFLSIGLEEKTAQSAVTNAKVTANLTVVISEVSLDNSWQVCCRLASSGAPELFVPQCAILNSAICILCTSQRMLICNEG